MTRFGLVNTPSSPHMPKWRLRALRGLAPTDITAPYTYNHSRLEFSEIYRKHFSRKVSKLINQTKHLRYVLNWPKIRQTNDFFSPEYLNILFPLLVFDIMKNYSGWYLKGHRTMYQKKSSPRYLWIILVVITIIRKLFLSSQLLKYYSSRVKTMKCWLRVKLCRHG